MTVLSILVAAALPLWSHGDPRDKEEELIFRGLQYAEAIRVFQHRFGRLPVRLEELIEVEPRCIRQLWKDPMTEDGSWALVFAGSRGGAGAPRDGRTGGRGGGGSRRPRATTRSRATASTRTRRRRQARRWRSGRSSASAAAASEESVLIFLGQTALRPLGLPRRHLRGCAPTPLGNPQRGPPASATHWWRPMRGGLLPARAAAWRRPERRPRPRK